MTRAWWARFFKGGGEAMAGNAGCCSALLMLGWQPSWTLVVLLVAFGLVCVVISALLGADNDTP